MKNVLANVVDMAAEEIVEMRTRAMQQATPSLDLLDDIEYPEMKENLRKSLEDMDNAKEEMVNKVKESGTDFIEDIRTEINDLGVDLGLLASSTAEFSVRTALIVPSIISFTAFGPALAPQQAPVLIKELTQEANELSTLYDKVNSKMNRLHLRELGSMSSFGLRNSGPKYAALNSIMTTTETALAAAKPLILSSGADCDGEKGTPITVDIPDYGYDDDIRADNCENYDRIYLSYGEPDAINCNRYQSLDPSQPRACTNCLNYYPINVNLKIKGWIYMKSKTFKVETTKGIELASDGTADGQPPRDIQGIKLTSDTTAIETGALSISSDTLNSVSINQVSVKSTNGGISLESKGDIVYKTEGNITTESNNTTQTATGSGTLVYDNGMDIVVKNGNASITTQVGSFTVTTKKDNIFITEANFKTKSAGTSEIESGDTITITSDAGMNITIQKDVLETILGNKTSKISGDKLLEVIKSYTRTVTGDLNASSANYSNEVTDDINITGGNYTRTISEDTVISTKNETRSVGENSSTNITGAYSVDSKGDASISSNNLSMRSLLDTNLNVHGSLNVNIDTGNTIFENTIGNFSIRSNGYIEASTSTGMQIMSKEDIYLNSRATLNLNIREIIYTGMYPVPGSSGALNCIATCPFTGVTHWANSVRNINVKE